jgi:hypothetical protein
MSETPAPYWITRVEPIAELDGRGWRATVSWHDAVSGHELRWQSEAHYETEAEALLAAQDAEADHTLLDRLLAERPRDLTAYWRARAPWLYEPSPPRVELPFRPFAEWEREVFRGLRAATAKA